MGFRFRRSVKLLPGVRLNLSSRGISATVGVRGASVNVGPSGTHLNLGLPGTGISYRTRLDRPQMPGRNARRRPEEMPNDRIPPSSLDPDDDLILNNPAPPIPPRRSARPDDGGPLTEYRSRNADALTSPGLTSLSRLLAEIAAERARVSSAIQNRTAAIAGVRRRVERAGGILSRTFVHKTRRTQVVAAADTCEKQLADLSALLDGLAMDADFELSAESQEGYGALTRAFEKMKGSAKIWDVSASCAIDRARARASHAHEVVRSEVALKVANLPEVDSEFEALHFQNGNGADLFLYPYFLAIPRNGGGFSLMDLREITVTAEHRVFVEEGEVPRDALIVGHSWERSNKDGSPDKRFAQNRQIPNCYYSELQLRSQSGLMEVYQFSNADVASAFASAFSAFVASLPSMGEGRDASEATLSEHRVPQVNLPQQPVVPSLIGGGVFIRALLLAAIVVAGVAIATPEGRTRGEAALSKVEGVVAQIWPKQERAPSPDPTPTTPETVAATLVPAPPEIVPDPSVATPASVAVQKPQEPIAASAPSAVAASGSTVAKPRVTVGTTAAPAAPAARPQIQELSADQLLTLQTKLISLGYQEGEPERHMGPRVIRAFNHWRQETGKAPVSSIGPDEYEAFIRAINR